MKDTNYKTVCYFTLTNSVEGVLPKIGRKKLLEKLAKQNINEADVDKTQIIDQQSGKVSYYVNLTPPRTAQVTHTDGEQSSIGLPSYFALAITEL